MATHFLLHYGPWEDMVSVIIIIQRSIINHSTLIRTTIILNQDYHQVTDHRHQLDSKLASLLRIVVEDSTRTKQGLDSLYRRLVTLLVLRFTYTGYHWPSLKLQI